jgi:hypothetical protein
MTKENKKSSKVTMVRMISILLLLTLGISAMFGGSALIIDPSGGSLHLSTDGLLGTFFTDYLLPGIILFVFLGVFGLSAAILTIANFKYYPLVIIYQGVILTIWIMVQIYLLPQTHALQFVYGFMGLLLIMLGNYLRIKTVTRDLKVFY